MSLTSLVMAQESVVTEAEPFVQSKEYNKAIPLLDKAIKDSKTGKEAKTWHYRSFAYKDKYNVTKDTTTRKIAVESLLKTLELDQKGEYKETTLQMLKYIVINIYNDAVGHMNSSHFPESYRCFKEYISIMESHFPKEVTSQLVFYTGYTAYMAHYMEPAKTYLEKARSMKHSDPLLYELLAKEYWQLGEKEKSIEILDEAVEKFPRNKDLFLLEIDYLMRTGNTKKAVERLDGAIKLDPTNVDIRVLQAQLYEVLAKIERENAKALTEKARNAYNNVLKQQPNNWKANYNLALSYYNEGVNMMNDLSEDDEDIFALMEIQDEAIVLFKKAKPFMEKAHELQPKNLDILIGLSGIYFSLNNADKASQIQQEISQLEGKNK